MPQYSSSYINNNISRVLKDMEIDRESVEVMDGHRNRVRAKIYTAAQAAELEQALAEKRAREADALSVA